MHPLSENKALRKEGLSTLLVHPTAVIGPEVKLGAQVQIGPYAVITGKVIIGDRTHIHAYVSIGAAAQDTKTPDIRGSIQIGDDCIIREYASVHASKYYDGMTRIGNTCYIMAYSHVAHDVTLEDNIVLNNNVALGGHVLVQRNAVIMSSSAAHQFCRIGAYTALAPFSGIRQDLPPYCLFSGLPARFAGLNLIALKRAGIPQASIDGLKRTTALFFQKKMPLEKIKEEMNQNTSWANDSHVRSFLNFIEESNRGVSRKTINEKSYHDAS